MLAPLFLLRRMDQRYVFVGAICGAIERDAIHAWLEQQGWTGSFNTAFRAGGVMGFSLCGVSLLVLHILIGMFSSRYNIDTAQGSKQKVAMCIKLMECLSGYGLGGSSIALFGRVGGGIYTKAADVGADLAGALS